MLINYIADCDLFYLPNRDKFPLNRKAKHNNKPVLPHRTIKSMDLNSLLFPGPKSSYNLGRIHGELIWVPKNFSARECNDGSPNKLPNHPLMFNSRCTKHEGDKLEEVRTVSPTTLKSLNKDFRFDEASDSSTSSGNIVLLEGSSKQNESYRFSCTHNSRLSKLSSFFSQTQDNFITKPIGDEEYESADEKVLAIEEKPLSKTLVNYSKAANTSQLDKSFKMSKSSSFVGSSMLMADTVDLPVYSPKQSKAIIKITKKAMVLNLSQDNILSKNIQVIKNNLYFKINREKSLKDKKFKLSGQTLILPKFDENGLDDGLCCENNYGTNDKIALDEIKQTARGNFDGFKKVDEKKTDRESFVERLEDFSDPPLVHQCFNQRYMNPRISLGLNSLIQNSPSSSKNKQKGFGVLTHNKTNEKKNRSTTSPRNKNHSPLRSLSLNRNNQSVKTNSDSKEEHIPCMYLRSGYCSSKLLIYFHGNGEDINLSFELLSTLRDHLKVSLIYYNNFTNIISIDSCTSS